MDTSALFVEIVIAGTQSIVWIGFFVLCFTGTEWLQSINNLKISDWVLPLSILTLSFVYPLGIIIDRLADWIYINWDKKIQSRYLTNKSQTIAGLRYRIENESYFKHIEYTRSRLRIARASTLNFFLITISGILFILISTNLDAVHKSIYGWSTFIFGSVLTGLSVYSWYILTNANYKTIVVANKHKIV